MLGHDSIQQVVSSVHSLSGYIIKRVNFYSCLLTHRLSRQGISPPTCTSTLLVTSFFDRWQVEFFSQGYTDLRSALPQVPSALLRRLHLRLCLSTQTRPVILPHTPAAALIRLNPTPANLSLIIDKTTEYNNTKP